MFFFFSIISLIVFIARSALLFSLKLTRPEKPISITSNARQRIGETFITVSISPPPHAFNQLMAQKAQHESDGMAEDLKSLGRVRVSAVCLEINLIGHN